MTPENFCYWLRGFFEMQTPKRPEKLSLNDDQVKMIEEHLHLVFQPKIDLGKRPEKSGLAAEIISTGSEIKYC